MSSKTDDDIPKKPHKKGKSIQPLHEEQLKKQMAENADLRQANADVLAELARKTAELAEQVKGHESPRERVLRLEEPEDAKAEDIAAAVEETIASGTDTNETSRRSVEPVNASNPAANVIRQKLNKIYSNEPDASTEAAEAVAVQKHRSKHQQFMYELTTSGKSLAEIQTEWHEYYTGLDDDQKHEVWQEFYANQSSVSAYAKHSARQNPEPEKEKVTHSPQHSKFREELPPEPKRPNADVKAQLLDKINAGGKLKPIHHIKSALFGLGLAAIVGLAVTFVFFNEVFIAPFVSPSKTVSATPIIGSIDEPIGDESKIIIPKINLEVPVVYGLNTIEEDAIQDALEDGVVHYATSPEPGEVGNSVIVGHSSNNILNSGKYKFAFVLLRRLDVDDTFFIHKDGVRYTYKIYDKKVVAPTDISVLGDAERENSMTLITCDPPGTSLNRLIIVAEQITPDPSENTEAETRVTVEDEDIELPSNAPSLWSRINPFD